MARFLFAVLCGLVLASVISAYGPQASADRSHHGAPLASHGVKHGAPAHHGHYPKVVYHSAPVPAAHHKVHTVPVHHGHGKTLHHSAVPVATQHHGGPVKHGHAGPSHQPQKGY